MKSPHIPVLLNEVLDSFKEIKSGIILDCTLGYGGHSEAILRSNPNLKIIACDRDDDALSFCYEKFRPYKDRIEIHKSTFGTIFEKIKTNDIKGILADIGVSSLQLDLNERGFSINSDTLDMRMDKSQTFDAKELINSYSLDELTRIFYKYGELPNAKSIATKIVAYRQKSKITSAKELASIIGRSNLKNRSILVATLVFQAIRIEVNKELNELENLLKHIEDSKIKDAVLDIITFHSLEDRIVKTKFKEWEKSCICPNSALKCECGNNHAIGKIVTKKPLSASKQEMQTNSRSSCAKLRTFRILRQK
ncbi:16S rRNA (cytosine(1402)-N(4))-methyltransferase RsmH [Campylobacter hyointestinalis]|uniref:16S rRNA (cytosine(1402)-N(4))-methyltransferase RsmH n=1 Tax=Campylobacter hyointestinalis TaxID=198 RepID=UPI000DCC517C|nr:16S rRNA (cytosine(1402)-N(4))-methyltransferase RsmH [Campylobacter hyointestinalis]RAZ50216.1 16S rRNA (cytosine(1402)-N(4))-methyltransferase [Campylobacter hyointestinalis subsp. lawsonii]